MVCSLCNLEGFDNPKSSCALLQRSPCSGCLQLGDLDREILEVKSHLEALLSSRKALLTRVNEEHDPIVRRLPLELTTHIFSLCNPFQPSTEVFSESGDASNGMPGEQPVPFILGAVSRIWRTIVFSTPHLWNVVDMILTEDSSPIKRDLLQQWLARTGNCPLFVRVLFSLDIDDPLPPPLVQLLTAVLASLRQFSRRFKVLDLSLPPIFMSPLRDANPTASVASALENITFRVDATLRHPVDDLVAFDLGFLPSPRILTLSGILWRNVRVDVSNVTHLTVSYWEMSDMLEILNQSPRLRTLTLSHLSNHNVHLLPQPAIPVVHRGIQILDADILEMDMGIRLFDFLSFPSLQDLSCLIDGESFEDLTSFVLRSECRLKSLDFHIVTLEPDNVEPLFALLHLIPTLTSLRVNGFKIPDAFFQQLGSTTRIHKDVALDQHFLPHLDTLELEGPRSFEWSSILLLFPSAELLEQGGDFRRITEVKLVLAEQDENFDGDFIDKETVERILDLQKTVSISIIDSEDDNLVLSSKAHHGIVTVEDGMDEDSPDYIAKFNLDTVSLFNLDL